MRAKEIRYHPRIEEFLSQLENLIDNKVSEYPSRWLAIRLLERDQFVIDLLTTKVPEAIKKAREIHDMIHKEFGKDPPLALINERYKIVDALIKEHLESKR